MSEYNSNLSKVYGSTTVVVNALGLSANGEIIPIEHSASIAFKWLDRYCGVDWLMKTNDNHVLGIAARIQLTEPAYYHDPHDTFTIRYSTVYGGKTEYEKRLEAINKGYFYPYYTLQAYLKKENPLHVLSAALIKTKDLYDFVTTHSYKVTEDRRDNTFKVARWSDIKRAGYKILINHNL